MSEDFIPSRRNNHDYKLLGNFITDEDRCDSAELPEKLSNIAKNCNEVAEKLKKQRDAKHEKDEASSSKNQTRILEFQKMADVLTSENDKLSREIDKKPEDNSSEKGIGIEKQEYQSFKRLKAEYLELKQVCKEITGINKRWQNYNKEVQSYIRRLEEALQNQNTGSASATLFTSQQYREENGDSSENEIPFLTRYDNLLKEMCQLQKELESSKQTEDILREQLRQLSEDSQETIKILNCQLSIYKEDYEAEKRDKMTAQSSIMKLSGQLEYVRSQLKECQDRLKQVEEYSRSPVAKLPATPTNHFAVNFAERERNGSRRNGCLRSDGSSEISSSSDNLKPEDEKSFKKCDWYACPICATIFSNEKEYLEHTEICY